MDNLYSIGWNTFQSHLLETRKVMLENGIYTDVTLVSDDLVQYKVHKTVISAASTTFQKLLELNPSANPLLYLKGVNHLELESILQFIYLGEAKVHEDRIDTFADNAKDLNIKELNKEAEIQQTYENTNPPKEKPQININDIKKSPQKNVDIEVEQLLEETLDISAALNVQIEEKADIILGESGPRKRGRPRKKTLESMSTSLVVSETSIETPKIVDNTCPECGKKFSNKYIAITHHKSVHQGFRLNCQKCDKTFAIRQSLDIHVKTVHDGIRFNCDSCEKSFSQAVSLDSHVKTFHEGIRYKCDMCEKSYSHKSALGTHVKSIHEINVFNCKSCPEIFSTKYLMWKHSKKAHK